MKTILGVAALGLMLAGCTVVPSHYVEQSVSAPGAGLGVVSVEMRKGPPGTNSGAMPIFVDGKLAAYVHIGGAMNLYLPYGRHIVGIGAVAHSGNTITSAIAVDVSATDSPILRAGADLLGYNGYKIKRVN